LGGALRTFSKVLKTFSKDEIENVFLEKSLVGPYLFLIPTLYYPPNFNYSYPRPSFIMSNIGKWNGVSLCFEPLKMTWNDPTFNLEHV